MSQMSKYPSIKYANEICQEFNLDGCLVISFSEGVVCSTSYGRTKEQCRELKKLNIAVVELIDSGEVPTDSFTDCPWPMITQESEL